MSNYGSNIINLITKKKDESSLIGNINNEIHSRTIIFNDINRSISITKDDFNLYYLDISFNLNELDIYSNNLDNTYLSNVSKLNDISNNLNTIYINDISQNIDSIKSDLSFIQLDPFLVIYNENNDLITNIQNTNTSIYNNVNSKIIVLLNILDYKIINDISNNIVQINTVFNNNTNELLISQLDDNNVLNTKILEDVTILINRNDLINNELTSIMNDIKDNENQVNIIIPNLSTVDLKIPLLNTIKVNIQSNINALTNSTKDISDVLFDISNSIQDSKDNVVLLDSTLFNTIHDLSINNRLIIDNLENSNELIEDICDNLILFNNTIERNTIDTLSKVINDKEDVVFDISQDIYDISNQIHTLNLNINQINNNYSIINSYDTSYNLILTDISNIVNDELLKIDLSNSIQTIKTNETNNDSLLNSIKNDYINDISFTYIIETLETIQNNDISNIVRNIINDLSSIQLDDLSINNYSTSKINHLELSFNTYFIEEIDLSYQEINKITYDNSFNSLVIHSFNNFQENKLNDLNTYKINIQDLSINNIVDFPLNVFSINSILSQYLDNIIHIEPTYEDISINYKNYITNINLNPINISIINDISNSIPITNDYTSLITQMTSINNDISNHIYPLLEDITLTQQNNNIIENEISQHLLDISMVYNNVVNNSIIFEGIKNDISQNIYIDISNHFIESLNDISFNINKLDTIKDYKNNLQFVIDISNKLIDISTNVTILNQATINENSKTVLKNSLIPYNTSIYNNIIQSNNIYTSIKSDISFSEIKEDIIQDISNTYTSFTYISNTKKVNDLLIDISSQHNNIYNDLSQNINTIDIIETTIKNDLSNNNKELLVVRDSIKDSFTIINYSSLTDKLRDIYNDVSNTDLSNNIFQLLQNSILNDAVDISLVNYMNDLSNNIPMIEERYNKNSNLITSLDQSFNNLINDISNNMSIIDTIDISSGINQLNYVIYNNNLLDICNNNLFTLSSNINSMLNIVEISYNNTYNTLNTNTYIDDISININKIRNYIDTSLNNQINIQDNIIDNLNSIDTSYNISLIHLQKVDNSLNEIENELTQITTIDFSSIENYISIQDTSLNSLYSEISLIYYEDLSFIKDLSSNQSIQKSLIQTIGSNESSILNKAETINNNLTDVIDDLSINELNTDIIYSDISQLNSYNNDLLNNFNDTTSLINSISTNIEEVFLKNNIISSNINSIETTKNTLISNNNLLSDNSFNEYIQEIRQGVNLMNTIINTIQLNVISITNYETT